MPRCSIGAQKRAQRACRIMDLKRIQVSVYTAFGCRCGDVKQLPYLSPFKTTQIMQIGEKPRLHIVDAAYHLPGRSCRFR